MVRKTSKMGNALCTTLAREDRVEWAQHQASACEVSGDVTAVVARKTRLRKNLGGLVRTIEFRVWTGKKMIYQDSQYLASFIRRVIPHIRLDHGLEGYWEHESYLPNGGVIDEYLLRFTGLTDKNDRKIYEGDIVRYGFFALNDINKFGDEPWKHLPPGIEDSDITTEQLRFVVEWKFSTLYALEQHIRSNPDVLGVEVIGNIYENPELKPE